jgi:hypothetical protein
VLVVGDLPAKIFAAFTAVQPQGSVAMADDGGDGGDGGGGDSDGGDHGGDSDGGDNDSDADSGDSDSADADDDDSDRDFDEADDDAKRGRKHGSSRHGSDRRGEARHRKMPRAPRAARAPAELLATGLDEQTLASLKKAGYRVVRREALDDAGKTLVKLRVPRRMSLEQARRHIASIAPRSTTDFNHYYRPESDAEVQDSPCDGRGCFAFELIGWPQVQDTDCGDGVRIGLIDTAINAEHPALKDHHLDVIRLDHDTALPVSGRQHGTAIASLLLGSPESRAPGVLPGSEVVAVDAFHRAAAHDTRADAFDLVRALDILAERDVQAINMSLSGPPNELLEQAIARLHARKIVLVAAAGNKGPYGKPLYPAAYGDVIAVTAIDRSKAVYRHANHGDYIDFAAPGVDVWAAASVSGARRKTGTSFAAPFVTAVAAVIAAQKPEKSPAEIQQAMASAAEDLGKPGRDSVFGWGLVNARGICSSTMMNAAR